MTTYRPCLGCVARVGCPIKAGVSKALKGHKVSSIRMQCSLPFTEHFPPGTRVSVKVWDHNDVHLATEDFGSDVAAKMVPASVVCRSTKKRDKVLVLLDAKIKFRDETETEFCTAYPKDLEKLDEPMAEVCGDCGRLLVHGECRAHDHDDRGF